MREPLGINLSDTTIDASWNAMLGSIPPQRIALIHHLKERFSVLLLSNTNAIHVPAFDDIVARETAITNFKGLFHGAQYSCELGICKPNVDIFCRVIEHHSAVPARTLFIDDPHQHVLGARQAGMNAEHLDKEDVIALVRRLGML